MKHLLALAFLLSAMTTSAAEPQKDCELRLFAGDLYYGVFATALDSKKLTDEHLGSAIASSEPFNPIEHETRTTRNGALKDVFADLLRNENVRSGWPETVNRLRVLQNRRKGITEIRDQAIEGTKRVLAPVEYFPIASGFSSVSVTTLPDGRQVLAHFTNRDKIVITDLATRTEIYSVAWPKNAAEAVKAYISWYTDHSGKLWLYLVATDIWVKSHLMRHEYGSSGFTPIPFGEQQNLAAKGFDTRVPGSLVLMADNRAGASLIFDVSEDAPNSLGSVKYLHPGDWTLNPDDKKSPLVSPSKANELKLSNVFYTSKGPLAVQYSFGSAHVLWQGKDLELRLPFLGVQNPRCAIVEDKPGHVTVAFNFKSNTLGKHKTIFYDLDDVEHPSPPIEVEGEPSLKLRWIRGIHGDPLLTINEKFISGASTLTLIDPRTLDSVSFSLPYTIAEWFQVGNDVYFTMQGASLYKLYSSEGEK